MSEYINNSRQRKETLLRVLRGLHNGETAEQAKAQFAALAREATSTEIAEAEQLLIDEGIHPSQIQSLCDVHVAVFREGLAQALPPESVPGHPVHTFQLENRALERLLDQMADCLEAYQAAEANDEAHAAGSLGELAERLWEIDRHFRRKEHLLFPYLERYGFMGPSQVMWGLHDQIRVQIKRLQAGGNVNGVADAFQQVDEAVRGMIYKEEKILFPAALERLANSDWQAIAEQEAEIGYCLVDPRSALIQALHEDQGRPQTASLEAGSMRKPLPHQVSNLLSIGDPLEKAPVVPTAPQPDAPPPVPAVTGSMNGALPLDTGALTVEQIRLIFTHLPVDVTFVDQHDRVCFFSQTPERIFDRPAAIIGRKVQNCHPPQSVHRVQKILDDFRAGTRHQAAFWIQMKGRFVHISYYAVRSASGEYQGTLEVTQDLTDLRALQGERRLLDEG